MKRRLTMLLIALGYAVLLLTAAAGPVQAAFGESVDLVALDQTALVAKRISKTVNSGYTVQERRSDSVTLREYVTPTGVIFAIAWNGLIHVFSEVGGTFSGTAFDWALPFFFGRTVIIGYEGAASSIGNGPYWAY